MGREKRPNRVEKLKSNAVGNTESKQFREMALLTLDKLTEKRKQDGYFWVRRGTTTKQIHPDKLQAHLDDGWKKSKNG